MYCHVCVYARTSIHVFKLRYMHDYVYIGLETDCLEQNTIEFYIPKLSSVVSSQVFLIKWVGIVENNLYVTVDEASSCNQLSICVFHKRFLTSSTSLLTNNYKRTNRSLYNREFPSYNSCGVLGSKGDRMLLYHEVGWEHEILCLQGTRVFRIEMGSVGIETQ